MTISYLAPRSSLVQKFSSFLLVEEIVIEGKMPYVKCQWREDVQLARNIAKNQLQLPTDENQCFLYWLNKVNNNPYAKSHLVAYLQSSCYWAVQKFFAKIDLEKDNIATTQFYLTAFDTVIEKTANIEQLTSKFNQFNPDYSSVETYSEKWLRSAIYDTIYQIYGFGKYSQWGLLKNITKKLLQTALYTKGYNEKTINDYLLLWDCFQKVYSQNQPTLNNKKLTNPTPKQINDIIKLYQILSSQNLTPSSEIMTNLTPIKFEKIMTQCQEAVNIYQQQRHINAYTYSFTTQEIDEENKDSNIITEADLSHNLDTKEKDTEDDNLLSYLNRSEINLILKNQLKNLDYQGKIILTLNNGLGLNQSTIAILLDTHQTTVSRQRKSITASFLKGLTNQIRETLLQRIETSEETEKEQQKIEKQQQKIREITSPDIKEVNEFITSWLSNFFQKDLYRQLEIIFLQLTPEKQQLLSSFYGGLFDLKVERKLKTSDKEKFAKLANIVHKTEKQIKQEIHEAESILQQQLIDYVNQKLNLNISRDNKEISNFVEKWCYSAPYGKLRI
ncbi:hypothetical protein [Geminocystis herdmanii]|uniref:hypothetical protein n=1 Tax=Geminocystis herdmanii TaxID=669359 RepID=UPI00034BCF6D|nr:hypothetical protein [Geminocystis herdmanii]